MFFEGMLFSNNSGKLHKELPHCISFGMSWLFLIVLQEGWLQLQELKPLLTSSKEG